MLRPWPDQLANSFPDLGDPLLVSWAFSWTTHAVVTSPLHLFDANIFWPHEYALAYTETPFVLVPAFALFRAFGASEALAFNLLTLGLFAFTLSATYSLARWFTGRTDAAVISAIGYAFSAYALAHIVHLNLLLLGLFPMAFLCLFRLLEERTIGRAVLWGLVNVIVLLGSLYYAAIYAVCALVILAGYVVVRRFHPGPGLVRALLIAGAITVVAAPFLWPYFSLGQTRPLIPESGITAEEFVTPAPGSLLYGGLEASESDRPEGVEHTFFPGFATLVLGAVGFGALVAFTVKRERKRSKDPGSESFGLRGERLLYLWLLLAGSAVAMLLALGPELGGVTMPLELLHEHVPGFRAIRVASRFAVPALLSLALLAAVGFAVIIRRWRHPVAALAAVAVGGFLLLELSASLPHTTLPTDDATLAVYRALDRKPDGAVVELPIVIPVPGGKEWALVEAPRMVYSAHDWKPRFNGYSGGGPDDYLANAGQLNTFPSRVALAAMRRLDIRYAVLHVGPFEGAPQFTEEQADAVIRELPPGTRVERHRDDWLVELPRE
jgi:hypothetical protein